MTRTLKTRISTLFLAAAATAAFAAPSAQAGPLVASGDCASKPMSQVFLPWADPAHYFLADGGSFESGAAGWSLDGAAVSGGNEPWSVSGPGASSLTLASGDSAVSGVECVGITEPTLRFFAKGSGLGRLEVTVHFEDALGNVQSAPAGSLAGTGGWTPGVQMPIVAALLPLLPGETTPVRFEFRAAAGNWKIDDVYVDPFRRG